ncbi:GNAT family N-acetyltransferase [Peribacillus sp. SCS-26]|uniref:GNAT family N-acetyltransferase n=1 Tax=Paraperibacillus marinus TaxID=3115295 RepID=UPI003906A6FE
MGSIKLKLYEEKYKEALGEFVLPAEQGQFTGMPADYEEAAEGQNRIVIVNGEEPVGFFLLHSTGRVLEYSSNESAMLLTAFSINHVHQGKGYAKRSLLQLPGFVKEHFPSCKEITLGVNHRNAAAQNLYSKTGFEDTGRRKIGKKGEQWIMRLTV